MYLTIEETANQLGVTVRQVRYMVDKGRLPARKQQGRWSIDSNDLPRNAASAAVCELVLAGNAAADRLRERLEQDRAATCRDPKIRFIAAPAVRDRILQQALIDETF